MSKSKEAIEYIESYLNDVGDRHTKKQFGEVKKYIRKLEGDIQKVVDELEDGQLSRLERSLIGHLRGRYDLTSDT